MTDDVPDSNVVLRFQHALRRHQKALAPGRSQRGPNASRLCISQRAGPRRRRWTTTEQQTTEARLADASTRIDEIASRAQQARDDTRVRVEQRVNALRTRQTEVRSRASAAVDAEAEAEETSADLERDLIEMDVEITIAEAQLDIDSAKDRATFESAVRRHIEAYRAFADLLDGRGTPQKRASPGRPDAPAESIRATTALALERLQRYRDLTNEVSDSLRAGVLAALDDLDRNAADVKA
jgi:chromosome segregation ATPase